MEEDCLVPRQSLCWHLLTCLLYAGCNSVALTGSKCVTRKDRELEGRRRGREPGIFSLGCVSWEIDFKTNWVRKVIKATVSMVYQSSAVEVGR